MANHKSAIKRHKQSEKRRARNVMAKTVIKSAIKKVRESVTAGNAKEAQASLKTAVKLLDSASSKSVLHKNNSARKISRLTKAVNSVTQK